MTTTETTAPALKLADEFAALAEHLRVHHDLPPVNFARGLGLQIVGNGVTGAAAVHRWGKSMFAVTVTLHRHGDPEDREIRVQVGGTIGDLHFKVWDTETGDLRLLADPDAYVTSITWQQLTTYVESGKDTPK